MQGRGFTPTIIKDIIQNGQKFEAKAGRTSFYSKELNTTVITEKNGKIVTVRFGK